MTTMTTMTAATGLAQDTGTYRGRLMAKRAFDLVVVAVSLVVLSPLFFAVAAALLVSEGRPILFRQRRVGRYGEPFTMWKFRTMVVDAEDQSAADFRSRKTNQQWRIAFYTH